MATAAAHTLLDMAVVEQKPIKKAILISMFKGRLPSPIDVLPVKGANALSQSVVRMTDPGSPSLRALNTDVAAFKARFADRDEVLTIMENKIVIDKVLLDVKSYVHDPVAMQTRAYGAIVKNTLNHIFINGDPTVTPVEPAGLDFRLRTDAHYLQQSVNANNLDVDASEANRLLFMDHLDDLFTRVNGGAASFLGVNRQTWIKIRSILRAQKVLDTTKDQFDRVIMVYGNSKILDCGNRPSAALKVGDGTATDQVIGDDTSTSTFGTAASTPIYCFSTEGDDGAQLLQLSPMKVQKLGIDAGNPSDFVIDVYWPWGFSIQDRFALGSIQGLNIT